MPPQRKPAPRKPTPRKPTWQQATALVSLSTCGAMTGFAFAHGTVDDMTSPVRMPVHLLALDKPAKPASAGATSNSDSALRSAVVTVATNYLRLARNKTPAEMEAMIWGTDSVDGVDHGESCAAFASLTLALGAQATGQQSWVSGGSTYPWPLHQWADVRVDPNPASPQIISIMQDAQAHNRWHPLGDGYQPQPGDWVMFDGHVEVITSYSGGVLSTIGGDSSPNLSVNAHTFSGSLAAQGVTGFVNNGELLSAVSPVGAAGGGTAQGQLQMAGVLGQGQASTGTGGAAVPGTGTAAPGTGTAAVTKGTVGIVGTAGRGGAVGTVGTQGLVAMPGMMAGEGIAAGNGPASGNGGAGTGNRIAPGSGTAAAMNAGGAARQTGGRPAKAGRSGSTARARASRTPRGGQGQRPGTAAIPGLEPLADSPVTGSTGPATPTYTRNPPPTAANHVPDTTSQQAFISQIAPGAIAAQSRYGIPAAVTIAQAIDESGWGQSALAIRDNNLFGIKGTGPAGSDLLPTQEYQNGQWVTINAAFRVYHNVAESIADHSQLLATGQPYQHAMADRHLPDAFATDLTGVYATDPQYGSNLIAIMRLYNLYQYDAASQVAPQAPAGAPTAAAAPAASAPSAAAPGAASGLGGTGSLGGTAVPGASLGTVRPNGTAGQGRGAGASQAARGAAIIPAVLDAYTTGPSRAVPAGRAPQAPQRPGPRVAPRDARPRASRYVPQIPHAVTTAFITTAKAPLSRAEPLYKDVASRTGIRWELLAACDWMQCQAHPRLSPVYGEKLGAVNPDGTVYRTKSGALDQVANELIELAMAVYWIDITARRALSVRDLAKVFAAFRWGGLLKLHDISAMEFPYSVEGLTAQHTKMRWPDVKDRNTPDKPGSRFRPPFGAVPVVLCLGYPAIA